MVNFALCDDNTQLLSKLEKMLDSIFIKHDFSAQISLSTNNPNKLINYVKNNNIDVLFLDIDLNSNFNGIEIAKRLRKDNPLMYLIFITGHFEYIVSAYECKTFDFIQKPFSQSKLESTLIRLFEDLSENKPNFIELSNHREFVNQNLVNYIQKDGMKAIYNTDAGNFKTYASFSNLANTLPNSFVRCHKSYIANINKISSINLIENTIFFPCSKCFIGPKYKNHFVEVLNHYGNIK